MDMLFRNHKTLGYFAMALGLGVVGNVNADYYNPDQNWNQNPNYNTDQRWNQNSNYNTNQGNRAVPSYEIDIKENPNQNPNQYQNSRYQNSNTDQASDQELAKKVQDKINSGWFSKRYADVVAKVVNGNVTLSGQVKTWDDKAKLEEDIRNMKNVSSLNSQITVQEQNSMEKPKAKFSQDRAMSPADEQLNKKIRENISSGWLWTSYKDIGLNTSNGVVTLEGSVDSLKDQQKLINEIQKIDGVRSVKSNLRIQNR